jgi:hypothetical protein
MIIIKIRSSHALCIALLFFGNVFPWGKVGHEVVAFIADKNLSPAAREKIKPLLAGETFEEISIWADTYKQSHRNTGPWHYINLPVRQIVTINDIPQYYSLNGHHPTDNVISQIKINIRELKNQNSSMKEKQIALKFLVHFMGDVHMPLHVGDDNDAGGNDKRVRYFSPTSRSDHGHVTNLHSLWDNLIEVKAAEDPAQLGDELNKKISDLEKQKWSSGSVENWAIESYSVSKNIIYPDFLAGPTETVVPLPRNYYSKMRPICNGQLEKAGVRLAKVLEEIFGK